jgi:hypothetical protein
MGGAMPAGRKTRLSRLQFGQTIGVVSGVRDSVRRSLLATTM